MEEPEDSNSNKEIMGDNIEEFSTFSPLEVILVAAVTNVFHEDNTLYLPEVTAVTIVFDDVLSADLLGKLPPAHDIQHAVDLIPGANLPDLPHPMLNLIEQTECGRQVDELSLEIKQQCIVPNDVHFYEDKF